MFTIDDNPQFRHAVEVDVPVDGGHRRETLQVTFNVVPSDEADGFDLYDKDASTKFLQRIVASMDDLADRNGQKVPYSDELRDRLLRLPYVRLALTRAYMRAVTKAREGN